MVKNYNSIKLGLLFLLSSCWVQKNLPSYISEKFTYCYDGKDTKIGSLLKTDGYFVIAEPFKDFGYVNNKDTSYFNIMFYENGICVFNFFPQDDKGRVIDNKYIPLFFKSIINEGDSKQALGFYNGRLWGKYILEGDTIKAQCIYRPRVGETTTIWSINEVWYKIINFTTIIEIRSESKINLTKSLKSVYLPARFIPVKEKPAPDCWLMKQDWFKCE